MPLRSFSLLQAVVTALGQPTFVAATATIGVRGLVVPARMARASAAAAWACSTATAERTGTLSVASRNSKLLNNMKYMCKINRNECLNVVASWLTVLLLIVSIVSLVWVFINPVFKPDNLSFGDSKCFLFDIPTLIAFFGGCVSLWLVTFQLKKQADVETVRLLGYLREQLNTGEKQKIHFYLLSTEKGKSKHDNDRMALLSDLESDSKYIKQHCKENLDDEDKIRHSNVELFDYLGVLELGAIMLERGLISEKEFDNQFGYRIENVYRSSLRDIIRSESNKSYYKYMLQHFERIETPPKQKCWFSCCK